MREAYSFESEDRFDLISSAFVVVAYFLLLGVRESVDVPISPS